MTSAPTAAAGEEADVDFGRFGRALAQRWWLIVGGLVAGAVIGYASSIGGTQVYESDSVVYLGQPLGILGGNQVQSLNTNPSSARAIVKSELAIHKVSVTTGMTASQLRNGTSVTPVAGAVAKLGQNPLIQITVKGPQAAKVRDASNQFAAILVSGMSGYANTKITTLTQQQTDDDTSIGLINAALSASNLSTTDKLLLQLRLTQVQSDRTQATQLLSLARNVEAPLVVTHGSAVKTSARSHRNSAAVGGFIGLILGGIAALLWDPFVRSRRSA
ncbi:MAG: Wzz/FepE/Etk N-terminal domain-containing protein [Gaiellaceae bacterium]